MGGRKRRATLVLRLTVGIAILLAALLLRGVGAGAAAAVTSPPAGSAAPRASSAAATAELPADPSHARASSIIAEALKMPTAYGRLRPLTDTIGARLAGSAAEPRAVAWAKAEFEKDGLRKRLGLVMVRTWVRGQGASR